MRIRLICIVFLFSSVPDICMGSVSFYCLIDILCMTLPLLGFFPLSRSLHLLCFLISGIWPCLGLQPHLWSHFGFVLQWECVLVTTCSVLIFIYLLINLCKWLLNLLLRAICYRSLYIAKWIEQRCAIIRPGLSSLPTAAPANILHHVGESLNL